MFMNPKDSAKINQGRRQPYFPMTLHINKEHFFKNFIQAQRVLNL